VVSIGSHLNSRCPWNKNRLLRFVASRVNGAHTEKNLTDLTQFAGVIRLSEDPLAWQRRVRGEWE